MVTDFGLAALVADKIRSGALPVPPDHHAGWAANKGGTTTTGSASNFAERSFASAARASGVPRFTP
jgi:hypothetical protein